MEFQDPRWQHEFDADFEVFATGIRETGTKYGPVSGTTADPGYLSE
jgi:hypothetical protein